ncbi:hypothetical protein GCM10020331_062280 [Ectobacillus funiculus]
MFMQESGIADKVVSLYNRRKSLIFGICGGYQMLGQHIHDPFAVESPELYTKRSGIAAPLDNYYARKKQPYYQKVP